MSSYFIWIMLIGMLLMMWFVSRRQRAMQEEQKRRTEKGLVPGNWVRTIGGFYGTVVEVDGDVVTLATPLGDETLGLIADTWSTGRCVCCPEWRTAD